MFQRLFFSYLTRLLSHLWHFGPTLNLTDVNMDIFEWLPQKTRTSAQFTRTRRACFSGQLFFVITSDFSRGVEDPTQIGR